MFVRIVRTLDGMFFFFLVAHELWTLCSFISSVRTLDRMFVSSVRTLDEMFVSNVRTLDRLFVCWKCMDFGPHVC